MASPSPEVPADPVAALDGPDAVRPPLRVAEHRGVTRAVGGKAAAVEHRLVRPHHLDRDRAPVRIHADDHTSHECLPAGAQCNVEQGRRHYFDPSKPSSPVQQSPARANHDRATRPVVGNRSESDGPDTWTEPCADTVLTP